MQEKLFELANKLGIATSFRDAGMVSRNYEVTPDILQKLSSSLGYPANNEQEVECSLQRLAEERWHKVLEPIYVCEQSNVNFDLIVPAEAKNVKIKVFKDNTECPISYDVADNLEEKKIKNKLLKKSIIKFNDNLAIGYYKIIVNVDGKEYKSTLAIAPHRCYEAPGMNNKLWGFAIQLYSVKSEHNWGVGDFTDLSEFVKIASQSGADIIGVNPLNVLCHDFPENASPYQSISRLFLNPIYIDVEKVPEYQQNDKDQILGLLSEIKQENLINYSKIYPLKIKILEKCFTRFQSGNDKDRQKAFKDFCKEKGDDLERLALFQAIYEQENPKVWGG